MFKLNLSYSYESNAAQLACFADHEPGLWRAVITQALMDASSHSSKPGTSKHKADAIEWLKGETDDFLYVCDQAGLDPDYVRERAQEALARDCVWRLPVGEGWRTQAQQLMALQPHPTIQ